MARTRSKATPEMVSQAFHGGEGFKATAARLGMSPNTLRKKWVGEFGQEAFRERNARLRAASAAETARTLADRRVYKDVSLACSQCGYEVSMKSNRAAQLDSQTFLCPNCTPETHDRSCPVCDQSVDGARGMAAHFQHRRRAGDTAHTAYTKGQEDAHWADRQEGEDFVVCLECGFRAVTLARHIKAKHGCLHDFSPSSAS